MSEIIFREKITPKKLNLDGRPDGYWQMYDDDKPDEDGTFSFPLYSPYITKSLAAPNAEKRSIVKVVISAYSFLYVCGVWAVLADSWIIYILAILGYMYKARPINKILIEGYKSGQLNVRATIFLTFGLIGRGNSPRRGGVLKPQSTAAVL